MLALVTGGIAGAGSCSQHFNNTSWRELSYFGVKVAVIEPGFFNTGVTNSEKISRAIQEAWDQASPEVKEIYGEKFLASGE
ncbi:retinol dehydrogenase 16-like [Panthera tigris]|uniref:retinol dehydrogenase 16-like n=1 Tax=Panthera tigris TaxID=9694 RepID=UPI001C6FA602|nr:retinol dehydrogenase 16-like [Panthera tigris]